MLPGGSEHSAPGSLRQLTPHPALPVTFTGGVGPLAALDTGPGRRGTILLVPGFTGSKEDFAPLLGPVAEAGWRTVAVDQRGQFESPGPDDPAAYTVDQLAADLLGVATELHGEGPLHLLGHSFGGIVARAAVLAVPGTFASLTLLDSGPVGLTGPRAELLDHLAPLLAAGGVALVHETLEQLALTDPPAPAVPPAVSEFLGRRFLANSEAGLTGMAAAMTGEPDRVAALRATGVPVLVAHGADDDAWTPAAQEDMAHRLGARHEVVGGAVHSPAIEQPARTVELLTRFWAGVPAGVDA